MKTIGLGLAVLMALCNVASAQQTVQKTCLFGCRPQQPQVKSDPAVLALLQQMAANQAAQNQTLGEISRTQAAMLALLQSHQTQPLPAITPQPLPISLPPSNTPQIHYYVPLNPGQVINPGTQPGQVIIPGIQPGQVINPGFQPGQVIIPGTQPGQVVNPGATPGQIIQPGTGQPGQVINILPSNPGQVITPQKQGNGSQPGQTITPGGASPGGLNPSTDVPQVMPKTTQAPRGFQRYTSVTDVKWRPVTK